MKQLSNLPYHVDSDPPDKRIIDVFLPENGNRACIFFVHGGGWNAGCKEQWHSVMEYYCQLGYVCVSAGYRLTPQHRFPDQFNDIRLAYAFVKSRADEWNFDPDRIAAWGSSAGGHLVAMLATTSEQDDLGVTAAMTRHDTRPAAVVALCPVFSVLNDDRLPDTISAFLGGTPHEQPLLARQASPILRITAETSPFLIVQGDADDTTPLSDQEAMVKELQEHNVDVELVVLPGVDHGFGYGVTSDAQKATLECGQRFLQQYLPEL